LGSGSDTGPNPGPCGEARGAAETSSATAASANQCEVTLVNGEGAESTLEPTSDCSTESVVDSEGSLLQQGDGALEAMYNLYAISVGVPSALHPHQYTRLGSVRRRNVG
jgi:hypothetical protein